MPPVRQNSLPFALLGNTDYGLPHGEKVASIGYCTLTLEQYHVNRQTPVFFQNEGIFVQ